jgi:hypothetical protein
MSAPSVLLGYEVHSGDPVEIPVDGHLCVTGMTQKAGKTTALDAIIRRSGRRAITFITKRGEKSFEGERRILPYFRERADWQFVEQLMSAVMRQKMRFERGWIIRAARGAKTLADVDRNLEKALLTAKGMNADIYLQLHEYLKLVLPQIDRLDYADSVRIGPGLNVMDLCAYSSELQALVIRSVLEWVHEKESGVIVVIPEAWETLPEGRGSPVKLACEQIFRKGAGIGNFIWLDSQDLAGVWKEALRACSVWIMGVQGEINEVTRMLKHLPTPNSLKPKPEQVMCLSQGQFYVRFGRELKLVYVRPVWMDELRARAIARGEQIPSYETRLVDEDKRYTAHDLPMQVMPDPVPVKQDDYPHARFTEEAVDAEKERQYKESIMRLEGEIAELRQRLETQDTVPMMQKPAHLSQPDVIAIPPRVARVDADQFNRVIMAGSGCFGSKEIEVEAVTIDLERDMPEIEVTIKRRVISMDGSTLKGRIAGFLADGFFDSAKTNSAVLAELARTGASSRANRVSEALSELQGYGFLTKEDGGFKAVDSMKVRIKEE